MWNNVTVSTLALETWLSILLAHHHKLEITGHHLKIHMQQKQNLEKMSVIDHFCNQTCNMKALSSQSTHGTPLTMLCYNNAGYVRPDPATHYILIVKRHRFQLRQFKISLYTQVFFFCFVWKSDILNRYWRQATQLTWISVMLDSSSRGYQLRIRHKGGFYLVCANSDCYIQTQSLPWHLFKSEYSFRITVNSLLLYWCVTANVSFSKRKRRERDWQGAGPGCLLQLRVNKEQGNYKPKLHFSQGSLPAPVLSRSASLELAQNCQQYWGGELPPPPAGFAPSAGSPQTLVRARRDLRSLIPRLHPPQNRSSELGHQQRDRRSQSQEKHFQQQPGNRHWIRCFYKLQQTTTFVGFLLVVVVFFSSDKLLKFADTSFCVALQQLTQQWCSDHQIS